MNTDGSEFSEFDGQKLLALLAELDNELGLEGSNGKCRIVIVGGAAVALRVPDRVTLDVDVVSEGMPMTLRRAAATVTQTPSLAETPERRVLTVTF